MNLRIATYNVNNLFERAAVLDLPGFSKEAAPVLADIDRLNRLLENDSYTGSTGDSIIEILTTYDFHRDTKKKWFTINEVRGKLFRVQNNPKRIALVARGREEWIGWVELKKKASNEDAIRNTAHVIREVRADVVCVVEVEDRLTLQRFNDQILADAGCRYKHAMLIDGNDERGIDVGLLSNYEIRSIRSHVDDRYTGKNGREYNVFSRDCAEYEVVLPGGKSLWILCNHLKSKGYGSQASSNAKRKRQAERIKEILARFDLGKDLVVVAGDLNDTPTSAPLKDLMATPRLTDVLSTPHQAGPRWTYNDGRSQIDYLLVSAPLCTKLNAVGIERRGIHHKTNFGGKVEPFPGVINEATQASDHAAVWAETRIV